MSRERSGGSFLMAGVAVAMLLSSVGVANPVGAGLTASDSGAASAGLPPSPANPDNPIDDAALAQELAAAAARRTEGSGEPTVTVEVMHQGFDEAVSARVAELGGTVTGEVPGYIVQADIPASSAAGLALSDGVEYLRSPISAWPSDVPEAIRPPRTESVESTWNDMNIDAWHDAGIDGTDVRVGIIGSFEQSIWAQGAISGQLPVPVATNCILNGAQCYTSWPSLSWWTNANEAGFALHAVAPEADVYLGAAETTSDLYALVQWFINQGIDVLAIPSVRFMDGPGDGTGATDFILDYAVASGILVVGEVQTQYEGRQYWRGTWIDTDNDRWLEFGPGDETLDIGGCYPVINGLRWNDWGPAASRTNYDLFIYFQGVQVFPLNNATKGADQKAGAPPIEGSGWARCQMSPMQIKIRRDSGSTSASTVGDILEISLLGDYFTERGQVANSTVGPVNDSVNPAVLAVGNTAPVEPYVTGRGPTNGGVTKPDLRSEACITTFLLSQQCVGGQTGASAVVAGMAALVLDAGLAVGPLDVAAFLRTNALPQLGSPVPNNVEGRGLATLPDPPSGGLDNSPSRYEPLAPVRVFDTRTPGLCFQYCGVQPVRAILDVDVTGVGGVPATGVTAVAINVTMRTSLARGFVQAMPTLLAPLGATSTQNVEFAGQTRPNFAIVPVGPDGTITLYDTAGGHVFVDVLGYFTPAGGEVAAGRFVPIDPHRGLNTRTGPKPAAGSITDVSDFGSVDLDQASAVVLNITGTQVASSGFVSVYPAGPGSPPQVSTLNVVPGSNIANMIIVPLGVGDAVSLYASSSTHLLVDVLGYITNDTAPASTAGLFVSTSPNRVLDTRAPVANPLQANVGRNLVVASGTPVPSNAIAVSLNATVTGATAPGSGYAKVAAAGAPSGDFSNMNFDGPGAVIAAAVFAGVGTGGAVTITSSKPTHFIVDINGYFTGASPP